MPLRLFPGALLASFFLSIAPSASADEIDRGAELYQAHCTSCHGADGQGATDGYEEPLFGDETVASLARIIEQTMPEDDPEKCVCEEAKEVARYIFDEFYSLAARQRKGYVAKPRIELSRLTVAQHRNAIADLLGQFTPQPEQESAAEPGLVGQYFQSRGMSKADRLKLTRVDRRIEFDYGTGSPAAAITPDQFTVIWEGSLVAPETGHYEFRVKTENGARLYVNNDPPEKRSRLRDDSSVAGQSALIDAWVSSGKMREATGRSFLLGGRYYPIRLEFFKYKDKTSSIVLEWKRPGGIWSVLDQNHLVTSRSPRSFSIDARFPADDRSLGYERGGAISPEWHVATSEAAIAAANEVVDRLPLLADVSDDDADRAEVAGQFVLRLARGAFRRPLLPAEERLINEVVRADQESLESGVLRSLLLVLNSPHFLYTNLPAHAEHRQHAVASSLAFTLWDSIPSRALLEAADQQQLQTEDQVKSQAKAMLGDPRTREKITDFFRSWLEIEQRDLTKDQQLFPGFDDAVITDLRDSLVRFVAQVVWSRRSDYRELLLADYLILNDRLRRLYESDPPETSASTNLASEFRQFRFADQRRAGVLTHPYLLSALSYHNNTSPIHRGVFLTRNIVGRALKPPTEAVAFKEDEFAPNLSMREKITQLTSDSACMACHSVINPLGFALENYDPVGRWRTDHKEKAVITKAAYITAEGKTVEFNDAVDIAKFAVESEDAQTAFVAQLFRHLVRQDPAAFGPETLKQLRSAFAADRFNVQKLAVRIAVLVAMDQQDHVDHDPESTEAGSTNTTTTDR